MHSEQSVGIIAAIAANGVIGRDGSMPWSPKDYPGELAHFKNTTEGTTVIMGRGTWESLPECYRPLPDRENFVLSQRASFQPEGATRFSSLDDAVANAEGDAWIIGGGRIYEEAIARPYIDRMVLSHLDDAYEGDVGFPMISLSLCYAPEHQDERDGYRIVTYRRKR